MQVEVKEGECINSYARRVCNECGEKLTYCSNGIIYRNYSYEKY